MRTTDSQTHNDSKRMKDYKLSNIDDYEREKIEATGKEIDFLIGTIRNYIEMIDFCTEKGILIKGRTDLSQIRSPGQAAGPEGDIRKLISMFQIGQEEVLANIPFEFKEELGERMEK